MALASPSTPHVGARADDTAPTRASAHTDKQDAVPRNKRKRVYNHSDHTTPSKVPRLSSSVPGEQDQAESNTTPDDPIAHWAQTATWPSSYLQEKPVKMSSVYSRSSTSSRKRSSSASSQNHHYTDRHTGPEENGVFASDRLNPMRDEYVEECQNLLNCKKYSEMTRTDLPTERFGDLHARIHLCNEARVQRDITPWLVPSPENLNLHDSSLCAGLAEQIDAEWSRCSTMGSTRPKPDFAVGFSPSAFSPEERRELKQYCSQDTPAFFTGGVNFLFPFLLCELKSNNNSFHEGVGQNLHSGGIATRAIFRLYDMAYGHDSPELTDLNYRPLAFSVTHDQQVAVIHAYFGVWDTKAKGPDKLTVYCRRLKEFFISSACHPELLTSYSFVRNVYDLFAPQQLRRIKDAVGALVKSHAENSSDKDTDDAKTEASFASFKIPKTSASSLENGRLKKELAEQKKQRDKDMEAMRLSYEAQISLMKTNNERTEQQLNDLKEDYKKLSGQLDEVRQDSKKQLEEARQDSKKLSVQLDEAKQDSKKQLEQSYKQQEQLNRVIDMLQAQGK